MHAPVLLKTSMGLLDPKPGEFFIDGTLDGGGHALAILDRLGPTGKLLGVDWDEEMVARFRALHSEIKNVVLVTANYADLPRVLVERQLPKADGLFLDLGFSSLQLEESGRGFSFMRDEPLIMTYSANHIPVRDILRSIQEYELAHLLQKYGGERYARRIARAIVETRRKTPIITSGQLAEVIRRAVPRSYERGRIDPATRTFQALRIYANDELENLMKVMESLPRILAQGGRVAVITFHSLEDRVVKDAFRRFAKEGRMRLLVKKPVIAEEEEIRINPRSRSAKLRAAVFI